MADQERIQRHILSLFDPESGTGTEGDSESDDIFEPATDSATPSTAMDDEDDEDEDEYEGGWHHITLDALPILL